MYIDFGELRLKVAVEPDSAVKGRAAAEISGPLQSAVAQLAADPESLIEIVGQPSDAQWRVLESGGQVFLVPFAGEAVYRDGSTTPLFGPLRSDRLAADLKEYARRIARAEMLKRVAVPAAPAA